MFYMPDLLCYSGKVPKIWTCLYNVVARCSEQILDEQRDFILQNDWELTYLIVFIIHICSFPPKLRLGWAPLARRHWRYLNENNCPLPETFTQFRPARARGKVIRNVSLKSTKASASPEALSLHGAYMVLPFSIFGYWSQEVFFPPPPCVLFAVVQVSDSQETKSLPFLFHCSHEKCSSVLQNVEVRLWKWTLTLSTAHF